MTRLRVAAVLSLLVLPSCRGKAERASVDRELAFTEAEPPDSAQADTTVPAQFRGAWAGRQAECGRPSESSLQITADSVNFYGSRGRVLAVDVMKQRVIEVLIEARGEGRVWRQNRQFQLSEDSASLTDLTTEGHVVRVRCKS